jgi:hypothetical protein
MFQVNYKHIDKYTNQKVDYCKDSVSILFVIFLYLFQKIY